MNEKIKELSGLFFRFDPFCYYCNNESLSLVWNKNASKWCLMKSFKAFSSGETFYVELFSFGKL